MTPDERKEIVERFVAGECASDIGQFAHPPSEYLDDKMWNLLKDRMYSQEEIEQVLRDRLRRLLAMEQRAREIAELPDDGDGHFDGITAREILAAAEDKP